MEQMMRTCIPDYVNANKDRWLFNMRMVKLADWKTEQILEGNSCDDIVIGPPFDTIYLKEHPEFKEGLVGVYRKKHC